MQAFGFVGRPTSGAMGHTSFLKPTLLSTTLIDHLFDVVERHKDRVDLAAIMPTVRWRETASELPKTSSLLTKT